MAGIYIHIPFCAQACFYCDFHFSTSMKIKDRVIGAIKQDLVKQRDYLGQVIIETVYFGGGTPSLISADDIKGIYQTIVENYRLAQNIEFTIEANPEDVDLNKVQEWISMGINRVSLGVQSLRSEDLIYMNRVHTKEQVFSAIEVLQNTDLDNISVDLIYGYPLLSDNDWLENLKKIIIFKIPHISCYCLTVEKNTPLASLIKKGRFSKLSSNQGRSHFLIARDLLTKHGYHHYEISNFSKPGHESLHNQNYWNKTMYLGVGPSAHSFNRHSRQWNTNSNINYCNKIENNELYYTKEILERKDLINEHILTNIRTSLGLDTDYLKLQMSQNEWRAFNDAVLILERDNMVKKEKKIYLTEKGMLLADEITKKLFLL
tara:strand:+ start:874 stop:1998 length:1125 start_codon:yes stop_codon:yes gene_type:complete